MDHVHYQTAFAFCIDQLLRSVDIKDGKVSPVPSVKRRPYQPCVKLYQGSPKHSLVPRVQSRPWKHATLIPLHQEYLLLRPKELACVDNSADASCTFSTVGVQ
jgi:hypothetical protein